MKLAVVGAGNVGGNLVRRLSDLGHEVRVANSRGPDSLSDLSAETGARPATVEEVAQGAEMVIISVPEKSVPELPDAFCASLRADTPVIDTGNYYPTQRDGRIDDIEGGLPESRWVERQIGHPVIKAFNGILATALVDEPRPSGDPARLGVAVAGDDPAAKEAVMHLVDELGFDPVDDGGIDDSWRQQPGTPWYGKGLNADGVRRALAEASPQRPAAFSAGRS